jgi:hypothetical protein
MGAHRRDYVWTGADTGWQKKVPLSEANYENIGDGLPYLIALFRYFPDFFLDLFHSENADYNLSFIQRLFLRINANYQYVDITACRGATKSFYLEEISIYQYLRIPLLEDDTICAYDIK